MKPCGVDRVCAAPHKGARKDLTRATEPGPETASATAAATATKTKLNLDPPEALQAVAPAEAAGLVPL
jgi:hypothetical protein